MKLLYLTLPVILLNGYSGYAQNTFPATGNTGIGVTNPTSGLVVQVEGSNGTDGALFLVNGINNGFGGSSTLAGIKTAAADGGQYNFLRLQNAGGTKFIINGSGNVGIGTAAPIAGLSMETGQNAAISPLTDVPNGSAWIGGAGTTGGLSMGQFSGNYGYIQSRNKAANKTPYQLALNPLGGFVGIGTPTPGAALTVVNSTPVIQLFDMEPSPRDGTSMGKIAFGSGITEYASIEVSRVGNSYDDVTALKFKTSNAVTAGGDGNNVERMRIAQNGFVGIGTTAPREALSVNGNIRSKQVVVELANWPDYVFQKDYSLPSLSEVKAYIEKNRHLPEIPSEQEIAKKGLDLGEMNKLLIKKVEEMTLYLIEKDAKEKEQEVINKKNTEQIDQLKKTA